MLATNVPTNLFRQEEHKMATKTTTKKSTTKKAAPKKAATKKAVTKKAVAKKAAPQKAGVKKTAAKKTVTKKVKAPVAPVVPQESMVAPEEDGSKGGDKTL
jgi:hypothetical protein